MNKNDIFDILKDERFRWISVVTAFLIILFITSSIRLSNWDHLTDQTTGEKIPLALDPYYFLRQAEVLEANGGSYPNNIDSMRYPNAQLPYSPEIMPQVTYLLFKSSSIFGNYTIQEINIFSPVLFYILGLILFFILTYLLTKSKLASIIASTFLAFVPAYLYRTMAGFSDHESIGMAAFLLTMIVYLIGIKLLEKKNSNIYITTSIGLLSGFLTILSMMSWRGVVNFIYIIFPLSFVLFWLIIKRKGDNKMTKKLLLFYLSWIFASILSGVFFGLSPLSIIKSNLIVSKGIIGPAVAVFIITDFIISRLNLKKFKDVNSKTKLSAGITAGVGIVGLTLIGKNIFSIIASAWNSLFRPWGDARTGLTVAENAQPYLLDWINQSGSILFWMFFAATIIMGFSFIKEIKNFKRKVAAGFFWLVLICSIQFSRISASSIMNGTNFISQLAYAVGLFGAVIFFIWLYFKEDLKISTESTLILSWMFFTLISGRAAQRMFFAITPFVAFAGGYLVFKIFNYIKINKDKVIKPIIIVLLIISLLGAAYTVNTFQKSITNQAKNTGPSAHYQWQNAMAWVRENTPEDSLFAHWWDYGYWVEYLGKRPAIADGGHGVPYWDHLIGRYVLTTPNPNSAYSFFKTHGVDYLLIDPTDLGKYPAYSKIGSGMEGKDRYSAIPIMRMDIKQTIETANETLVVYQGGVFLDEDINVNLNGKQIFLPAEKAVVAGVIWRISNDNNTNTALQPNGVFFYNNQRYDIPLRYTYVDGTLLDHQSGIESVVRITPAFDGQGIAPIGAAIYLSPKVSKSLFAQNYLLDNAFGWYDDITLVHSEDDAVVESLRNQGASIREFLVHGGLRGPIKIFKIDYPENIKINEEFLKTGGQYAELDNLEFLNQVEENIVNSEEIFINDENSSNINNLNFIN